MTHVIIGVCTFFALLMFLVLLSVGDITFNFSVPITSPLPTLGVVLLLFLMLPWFNGVSYVFSICSYVLADCSGWIPMLFGEMDHLPYRHSSFHSYFGCNLPCSIDQLFRLWCFMPSIFSSSIVCLCVPPDSSSVFR